MIRKGSTVGAAGRGSLDSPYGLLAAAVVASVQLFFSLYAGGYDPEQWTWGAAAISASLVGALLVPGYLSGSSLSYGQWALVGALALLVLVTSASMLWSVSPMSSFYEAARTAMYAGAFVLLLPAAARWGSLIFDATLFGALLPPAVYGLLQKIYPAAVEYTGSSKLETDKLVSSTVGYSNAFGTMCVMGALLAVSRVGSSRSAVLRGLCSACGVVFLVALYFSFSRGAVLGLVVGAAVLLALSRNRLETLASGAIVAVPLLWVVSHARELPALVERPQSLDAIKAAGEALAGPLWQAVLFAFAAQVLLSVLIRALGEERVPRTFVRAGGAVVLVGAISVGLVLGAFALRDAGGPEGVTGRLTPDDKSAVTRVVAWEAAWGIFREHPLTGTGADTFEFVYEQPEGVGFVRDPHSLWLSLLSNTGIFAFLSFAAFSAGCLALAARPAFSADDARARRAAMLVAGSAAAAAAYLAATSVDWHWYLPASTVPFFALAAVAASARPANPAKTPGSSPEDRAG